MTLLEGLAILAGCTGIALSAFLIATVIDRWMDGK